MMSHCSLLGVDCKLLKEGPEEERVGFHVEVHITILAGGKEEGVRDDLHLVHHPLEHERTGLDVDIEGAERGHLLALHETVDLICAVWLTDWELLDDAQVVAL